jgi:hypothetical protein
MAETPFLIIRLKGSIDDHFEIHASLRSILPEPALKIGAAAYL